MRRLLEASVIVVLALAGSKAAVAQETDACSTFKWPVDREQRALAAADLPTLATGGAYPALGRGVAVTLAPQATVAYAVKPARPPKSNPAYGAELTFAGLAEGGTLEVTLSDEGWIDVVQDGKILRSVAFSGRTGCPGIRKSVRFAVVPGPVSIVISDSAAPTIRLDIETVE